MATNDINEFDFYDSQDVVLDLETLYNSFIDEIDAIRSRFATPEQIGLTQLDSKKIENAIRSGRVNSNNIPQESRCNAFYRLLGLPIISNNGFYNPGWHPELNTDEDALKKRLSVANSILSNQPLQLKLTERERFPKSQLEIFAKQDSAASKLAYSVKFLRPITGLIEQDDPLAVEAQSFSFKQRIDDPQQTENFAYNGTKIAHILKPFMPDPRIDFIVFPVRNRVAVPFLSEARRQVSKGIFYKTPFIEKVARVRLAARNKDGDVPDLEKIVEEIKNNQEITDKKLIELAGGITKFYRSDIFIFNNLRKVFKVLVDALFVAINTIDSVESKIHWVPMPDPLGMEVNVTSNSYIPNDPNGMDIDRELDRLSRLKAINDNEIDLLKSDLGIVTNGVNPNSAFSSLDNIAFGSILSNVPTKYDERIQSLTSTRNELANKASKALRNIAIIMGDTSGLGLIDMYCIYAALWTVDKTTLVNMLDDGAIERLKSIPELQSAEVVARFGGATQDPIVTGTKFQTKVKEMFNIVDALIKAKSGNG